MKKLFIAFVLFLSFTNGFSQTDFVKYRGDGYIVSNSGDTSKGFIEHQITYPNKIYFTLPGEKKSKTYNAEELKGFVMGDKNYHSIKINKIMYDHTFAVLMNSPNSDIKMFRFESQPIVVRGNDYTMTVEHYIASPQLEKPVAYNDIKFAPVNKKVSKLVEKCPSLSQKILNKEEGYTLAMLTTDGARLDFFKKVCAEYENCK